jgi:chromosome partitioning protein
MAVLFAHEDKDVLLVDADDQETASDFTIIRNETLADLGGAGYTAIKLHGDQVIRHSRAIRRAAPSLQV